MIDALRPIEGFRFNIAEHNNVDRLKGVSKRRFVR